MSDRPEPFDPSCERQPAEIFEYQTSAEDYNLTPDEYVRQQEGTFNRENGHFLCTSCYIKHGQSVGEKGRRWVCP